jgi:hypothetical protein
MGPNPISTATFVVLAGLGAAAIATFPVIPGIVLAGITSLARSGGGAAPPRGAPPP